MKKIMVGLCLVLSLLITACGADYAAKAGEYKISEGELQFYLSSIKSQMSGTELASDEDWQTQEIEGVRAIDFAKERALEAAANNIAYVEVADFLGIKLNKEDEDKISATKSNLINQYGGEQGYKQFLKVKNVDDKFIDMLCRSMICSELLAERALSDNPITEQEKTAAFEKMTASGNYKAKHILRFTIDPTTRQPLSEEEQDAAKRLTDELYARILAGEDFDALMNEFSQDTGLAENPDGYVFGDGEMVAEFENGVKGLKENEVCVVKSDFGYHIIKRLPLEMSDLADKITSQLKTERLNSAMDTWKSEAGFSVVKNDSVFDAIS